MSDSRMGREKGKYRITAFYMEMLILAAVFVAVVLVLARVFALSGQMSIRAKVLTRAVHLAENAAEAFAVSDSAETFIRLADGNGQVPEGWEKTAVRLTYDEEMNPVPEGSFWVDVVWASDTDEAGGPVSGVITVYWKGEEVYTLNTAAYREPK